MSPEQLPRESASRSDLEEAFSPTNYPQRFTARGMRHIWFIASVACVRRRRWRNAAEAFLNAQRRFPPLTWRTGVGIIDIAPTVIE